MGKYRRSVTLESVVKICFSTKGLPEVLLDRIADDEIALCKWRN